MPRPLLNRIDPRAQPASPMPYNHRVEGDERTTCGAGGGAMSVPTADFDGAWKAALETYLPECLALLTPAIHAAIDWSRGLTFLDTELQQVTADAAVGPRAVDKLVKVWRHDGQETWVLIHIEAQHQRDDTFPRRMFIYATRLMDRFNLPVVSIAILGDDRPGWRPTGWQTELWGSRIDFQFVMVKLLDYRARVDQLMADRNPFAAVVLAHLETLATRRNAPARRRAKLAAVRRLYDLGYERDEVLRLFRLIDWLLRLPADLEAAFWNEVRAYEEEHQMSYITSVERIGIEKGLAQGRREGLVRGLAVALAVKFGPAGQAVAEELRQIEDEAVLTAVADRLPSAASLDDLRALYQSRDA
jgi:hypothetical protein